jgi:hypothetical protein
LSLLLLAPLLHVAVLVGRLHLSIAPVLFTPGASTAHTAHVPIAHVVVPVVVHVLVHVVVHVPVHVLVHVPVHVLLHRRATVCVLTCEDKTSDAKKN